jgi:predicted ester cyclase
VFAAALAIHIVTGLVAVVAGALAATAGKRPGRHPRAGRVFLWALTGIFTTATVMAVIRWQHDAHLFAIAVVAFGLGGYGYLARRRQRPGWVRPLIPHGFGPDTTSRPEFGVPPTAVSSWPDHRCALWWSTGRTDCRNLVAPSRVCPCRDQISQRTPGKEAVVSEANKTIVRRLVEEVMNAGRLDVVDELYIADLAPAAKRWIAPFREAFPDVHMRIIDLIAEADRIVGRFTCSATHRGAWRSHPPTGRRFKDIAEVYIFRLRDGKIVHAWGLEDNHSRMKQLGLI